MSYKDSSLRSDAFSRANAATPKVAKTAAAGTSATATVSGVDESGVVTLTAGSASLSTGAVATITFATPYSVAPDAVIISDGGGTGALGDVKASATVTKTAVTIAFGVAATASDVYKIHYVVVGGA